MDIRPIAIDELQPFVATFVRTMGFGQPTDDELERRSPTFPFDRSLAAFDRGQIVGTTFSHLFELTMPGGAQIPAAGITAVCVVTTHRRRGILSDLMRRQLAEARERNEPVALLIASESVIYGRYGFGLSSSIIDLEIDTPNAQVRLGREPPGRVTFVDDAAADKLYPSVYDRWRRSQPGAIDRAEPWWTEYRANRKPREESLVVYEDEAGELAGYARYVISAKWEAGLPQHALELRELTPVTIDAYAALWRHCLSADLVRKVSAGARPVDEPLRWMLANHRAMRVTRLGDMYWMRVLDVVRTLSSRAYRSGADLVLDVSDDLFGDVGGRFALSAFEDGASCERTNASPDLALSIADLGAIVLGGTAPSELARVGRIRELRPGALAQADAAFGSQPKPWCGTWF